MMLPFGELNRLKGNLFQMAELALGCDPDAVFLRPSSGLKSFTGKVVTKDSWDKDIKLMGFYDVEPEALVIAAPARKILHEWRTIVVNSKVVASSMYKKDDPMRRTKLCNMPRKLWIKLSLTLTRPGRLTFVRLVQ